MRRTCTVLVDGRSCGNAAIVRVRVPADVFGTKTFGDDYVWAEHQGSEYVRERESKPGAQVDPIGDDP
jgi:hypothetical protein